MQGILEKSHIDYVIYHLNLHFHVSSEISKLFCFENPKTSKTIKSGSIVFELSEKSFSEDEIISIDNIPVLFSIGDSSEIFRWENNSVVFNHDFLKSAFYLLSGYQETISTMRDRYDRFPYKGSLQEKLGVIDLPIVNYYFEFISKGIEAFCAKNNIPFNHSSLFKEMGFLLTHDVDILDTYTFNSILFRLKQLIIPANRSYSFKKRIYYLWKHVLNYINFFKRNNPSWDFEYLVNAAERRSYKSVFYFLHKDIKHQDSRYKFSDRRIRKLFHFLIEKNCEIGIHGSTRSAEMQGVFSNHLEELESNSGQEIIGVRQHRLIHKHSVTARIQENAGLKYDTSLGFAEHEGFRNSFCMPFKLYDFEKNEMRKIWQFPLVVMDTTIFMYRKIDYEVACDSIFKLIEQCKRFNGLFTLLWHNGNFDEEHYPFGKILFESVLDEVNKHQVESVTGKDCLEQNLANIYSN